MDATRESTVSTTLFIPVVLGSVRKERRSYYPARLLAERVAALGHETQLVDLRALALPMYDEEEATESHPSAAALRATIGRADAVLWHTPEYNHSFTSAIKNAIDYLDEEIARKPMAVTGLSRGPMGGVRAVEQLKLVLIELHGLPIRESVYFSEASTIFDAQGSLLRRDFVPRIDRMLADLIWHARVLTWGRAHMPVPERAR